MIRALYPRNPDGLPKGQVITKEGFWEVRETAQPLFNMLWTWIRTKDKSNVLETVDGKERHPGFELYSVIASETRDAVPSEQFKRPVFQQFLWNGSLDPTVQCIPVYS
jgi:hypothetical protein